VGSLSRPVIFQPVSMPLQHGIRFFRHLKPAHRSASLTTRPPTAAFAAAGGIRGFHVPFIKAYGVRHLLSTGRNIIHEAAPLKPRSVLRCLLAEASFLTDVPEGAPPRQPLWLVRHYDLYHRFTCVCHTHCLAVTQVWFPGGSVPHGLLPARQSELPYIVPAALYSGR
jgi:hypothetical protein